VIVQGTINVVPSITTEYSVSLGSHVRMEVASTGTLLGANTGSGANIKRGYYYTETNNAGDQVEIRLSCGATLNTYIWLTGNSFLNHSSACVIATAAAVTSVLHVDSPAYVWVAPHSTLSLQGALFPTSGSVLNGGGSVLLAAGSSSFSTTSFSLSLAGSTKLIVPVGATFTLPGSTTIGASAGQLLVQGTLTTASYVNFDTSLVVAVTGSLQSTVGDANAYFRWQKYSQLHLAASSNIAANIQFYDNSVLNVTCNCVAAIGAQSLIDIESTSVSFFISAKAALTVACSLHMGAVTPTLTFVLAP